MNQITIELCAEDRARLDRIAALIEAQTKQEVKEAQKAPEVKATAKPEIKAQEPKKEEPKAIEQANPEKTPAPKLEPVTDQELNEAFAAAYDEQQKAEAQKAPEVKLEDIRRLVVKLATNGKKAEARDVVKAYAPSVTEIAADKYGEVYAKLLKLEAPEA